MAPGWRLAVFLVALAAAAGAARIDDGGASDGRPNGVNDGGATTQEGTQVATESGRVKVYVLPMTPNKFYKGNAITDPFGAAASLEAIQAASDQVSTPMAGASTVYGPTGQSLLPLNFAPHVIAFLEEGGVAHGLPAVRCHNCRFN